MTNRDEAPGNPGPQAESESAMLEEIDWSDLQQFFLEHLRGQLDSMETLLAEGNLAALARIGHGLKGSGGAVLLPKFTELGQELEEAGRASDATRTLSLCRRIRDEYVQHRPAEEQSLAGFFAALKTMR